VTVASLWAVIILGAGLGTVAMLSHKPQHSSAPEHAARST
jgi:hypothetical protein